jgi:hypothetical protein
MLKCFAKHVSEDIMRVQAQSTPRLIKELLSSGWLCLYRGSQRLAGRGSPDPAQGLTVGLLKFYLTN